VAQTLDTQCQTFHEEEPRLNLAFALIFDGFFYRVKCLLMHVHLGLTQSNQGLYFHQLIMKAHRVVSIASS